MKVPGVFRNANTIREVPAGAVVFDVGSTGEEMYGVVAGEIEVRTPSGVTTRIGPDDTFGEMAVIDGAARSATAVALVDTQLAVIDRKTFLFLVHETPMFALQVRSSIADRLRSGRLTAPPEESTAGRLVSSASLGLRAHRLAPARASGRESPAPRHTLHRDHPVSEDPCASSRSPGRISSHGPDFGQGGGRIPGPWRSLGR